MSALPKTSSPQVQAMATQDANYLSAYNVCLQYELEESTTNANQLRHVRILGFLLLNAPSRGVRSEVAKCIHSCKDDVGLFDLGALFERHFILPFRKYKGRTPKPSDHPSRPSFEVDRNPMKVDIKEAPKNHQDAKDRALIRDNWRCVVTGIVHLGAPDNIIAQLEPEAMGTYTECAHIIPEATFFGVSPKTEENTKLDYSASILAVLKRFRCDIGTFNREKLYFEATGEKDRYEVKRYTRLLIPNMRHFVAFSTHDPENLPVPAPELIALHATCCKVAHLSGAADYIDRVYRDAERMGVLASDGTAGDILNYALLSMSNHTVSVQG